MPILNASPLVPFVFPWQIRPPAHNLVIGVKATLDILPGRDATLAADQHPPCGDVRYDNAHNASLRYASDFVVRKPKADILLVGHAYPSEDPNVCSVTLQVGSVRKTIAVFGDRSWNALGAQSEPAPFERMPLQWERALGGPLSDANPVGRGFKTGVLLPNLECPDALVRSPRDAPPPVGLGPLAPEWKPRLRRLGSFGGKWLRERWPFLPEDFDYQFFNAAPDDLQVAVLHGDEPFTLQGVHPTRHTISGRLPGITPRLFAHMSADVGGAFVELPLVLDTLWIDADALQLVLVWRGLCSTRDEEASDLATIYLTMTGQGETLDIHQARARYLAEGLDAGLLCPLSETAPPPAPAPPMPAPVPKTAPSWLAGPRAPAARTPQRHAGPSWLAEPRAPAARTPRSPPSMPPMLAPPPAPVVSREEILAAVAARESLAERDMTGVDLSGCDLSGLCLAGSILAGANLCHAKLDRVDLTEAVLAGVRAEATSFSRAVLAGADLHGALLTGACFAHAVLESANLTSVHAPGAVFSDVQAAHAFFASANLTGASFERAQLEAADFTGATIDRAVFASSHLDNARFYHASGPQCRFDHASLVDARMDDCSLAGASFIAVQAPGSVWERAALKGSVFQRADVQRANFGTALLQGAQFNTADGRGASFRKASLQDASMLKANLMHACFEAADLRGADLRGANLFQAETWRANLQGIRLDLAILAGSKLAT